MALGIPTPAAENVKFGRQSTTAATIHCCSKEQQSLQISYFYSVYIMRLINCQITIAPAAKDAIFFFLPFVSFQLSLLLFGLLYMSCSVYYLVFRHHRQLLYFCFVFIVISMPCAGAAAFLFSPWRQSFRRHKRCRCCFWRHKVVSLLFVMQSIQPPPC